LKGGRKELKNEFVERINLAVVYLKNSESAGND